MLRALTRFRTCITAARSWSSSVMILLFLVGCTSGASAGTIPAGTLDLVVQAPTVPPTEYHGPYWSGPPDGLLSSTGSNGSITGQALVNPEPAVSVFSDLTSGEAHGAAYLSYYAEVAGPAGVLVPLDLRGTIAVVSSGSGINDNQIVAEVGNVSLDATSLCGNSLQLEVFTGNSINGACSFSISTSVTPGTLLPVYVWAATIAIGPQNPQFLVANDSLKIDPILMVDPSFANAGEYSIELSPGFGNSAVPEPTSLVLFTTVLAGLGVPVAVRGEKRAGRQGWRRL